MNEGHGKSYLCTKSGKMASLKERFDKWKTERNNLQKFGDVFFWLLIIMMLIPGPRKVVATTVNRAFLHLKHPTMKEEARQDKLSQDDYQWLLQGQDGNSYSFSDLQGKVIFLNFWATWCPPCIAELPEIDALYEAWGDKVVFLLVSNQEAPEVEAFLEKRGYGKDLPVYYPATALPDALQYSALPTTIIISKEGKIVTRKTGAANWNSKATEKIFTELLR